jgi:hypothetical protein
MSVTVDGVLEWIIGYIDTLYTQLVTTRDKRYGWSTYEYV